MLHRAKYILLLAILPIVLSLTGASWNVSSTASEIVDWSLDLILADTLLISARVLSTNEDGCFIDAGSQDGVAVGQVYEIYHTPYNGGDEEVTAEVQIVWTRGDYSFAEPRGSSSVENISDLHFARLIHLPPVVSLIADSSEGYASSDLDRLLQAISGILGVRGTVRPVLGLSREPSWKITITPDSEGMTLRVTVTNPGGETVGSTTLDPATGEIYTAMNILDPTYLTGESTPFANFIAPPGRRIVSIACGNIVPGMADELAVLDGSNLWIYDLSRAEPQLLHSLTVYIPPGPVRHRDDGGSIQLLDINGDSLAEICISPPGGIRGEIWGLQGDDWVLYEYLSDPPRAVDNIQGGVLVAPYMINRFALDPARLTWEFPMSERDSSGLTTGFFPVDIDVIPETGTGAPSLAALDINGVLRLLPKSGGTEILDGTWGDRIEIAMHRNSPIGILTSPSITSDTLTLIDLYSGTIFSRFPVPEGPIIDLALGDIDRDGKSEIIAAVLEEDGVKIYY